MPQPLRDAVVIERSAFIAGPLAGKSLAQLGVEVIKVDDPRGAPDWTRWPLGRDGRSLYWSELNRGKRSVLVDTRSPEGRDLIAALAVSAGVYLTNVDVRFPLSAADLRDRRPDLVHVSVQGSRSGKTALDYTVNAALGHPWMLGPPEHGEPINHQLPTWDLTTGLTAALTTAAALTERWRHGRGATISLSLMDVAVALTGSLGMLTEAQERGDRERVGNGVYGAFGRDFKTADDRRVMVVAVSSRQWDALVAATQLATELDALATSVGRDFRRDADRYASRAEIAGLLEPWFSSRGLDEIAARLDAYGACWDVYQSMADFVNDDARASIANPLLREDPLAGPNPTRVAGAPFSWRADEPVDDEEPLPAVPNRGEHTAEVLHRLLGLDVHEYARLHDAGVVRDRPVEPCP